MIKNCHVINLNGKGENLNTAFGFIGLSNNIQVIHNFFENSDGGAIFFKVVTLWQEKILSQTLKM